MNWEVLSMGSQSSQTSHQKNLNASTLASDLNSRHLILNILEESAKAKCDSPIYQ